MPEKPKPKAPPAKNKKVAPEKASWSEDQKKHEYYYDDAHGYEVYVPEEDDRDSKAEQTNECPNAGGNENANKLTLAIWTIGHSTLELGDFLQLLTENSIETLADVRSYPGSRRYPHFNAAAMAASLTEAGIEYVPLKRLGGRRRARADSPNTVWRNEAFRGYADYMETQEFKDGITELLELAARKRTAIMCAEAVWWRCHRSMISDYLKAAGVTVEHIMSGGKNAIHPFTSAARIRDGKLMYGPETLF